MKLNISDQPMRHGTEYLTGHDAFELIVTSLMESYMPLPDETAALIVTRKECKYGNF